MPICVTIGIAALLGPIADEYAGKEHHGHRRENRPALPRVLYRFSKRVSQAGSQREDQHHLHQIRQRRGIFIRMRRVGIEKSAAVGAQHLDGFLRRQRSLLDHLCRALQRCCRHRALEVLDASPARRKTESPDTQIGSRIYKRAARHIHPEISDGLRRVPRESADQRHRHGDSHRRRDEILNRQRRHLREVAHRGVGRIGLPVRIRHEADGGVEGQIRRHRRGA